MKYHCLFLLMMLLSFRMQAQTSTCASDTLLFRECFSDSILKTDIELMRKVYNNILGGPRVNREYYLGLEYLEPVVIGRIYSDRGFWLPSSISHIIKTTNLDKTLRNKLLQDFEEQHPRNWNAEEAKAVLVRRLQHFDSLSTNKPLFFSTIYTDYGGDITKYVDALYNTSIMGNKKTLRNFMRKPSTIAIQNDLGYQFSLSLALYEHWIAQVRNGEVEEE